MTQVMDSSRPEAPVATDLAAAVHRVLAASPEPLTPSKILAALPAPFRNATSEELNDVLRRQVAAGALYEYPKYRSPNERYWDRSMPVHVATLVRTTVAETALPLSQLRRKLPTYAVTHIEAVVQEQVSQGMLHRHPAVSSRGGERYGARPPEPKDYLREELSAVFDRLEKLGFNRPQLRESAMALLQEEEWDQPPAAEIPAERSSAAEMPARQESLSAAPQSHWQENQPPAAPAQPQHSEMPPTGNVP